ncbi:hypothetical protein PLESHI_00460 [Plesiomonas shigelloides 302-73]|uniref:Uncharacterized protein n=1 Tax=Plesiomonas shigelloides 302-73 TaxID=1315976 RepID=R8AVS4_PLESH|nr:hypothetical protein PLESHI_00460 [Plesiomonas shigelloides 302-73]
MYRQRQKQVDRLKTFLVTTGKHESSDEGIRRVENRLHAEEVNLSGAVIQQQGLLLDEPLERSIELDAEGARWLPPLKRSGKRTGEEMCGRLAERAVCVVL